MSFWDKMVNVRINVIFNISLPILGFKEMYIVGNSGLSSCSTSFGSSLVVDFLKLNIFFSGDCLKFDRISMLILFF